MANLTVRNVPKDVHKVLRENAKKHHRSLNGEILDILAKEVDLQRRRRGADRAMRELDRMREEMARKYPSQPDSVELIRQDRDSR